jgi:hypothetical protein
MTIKLEIDTKQLVKDLDGFVSGIEELVQPAVLDQISRAIFSITGERFMIDLDNYARLNPKKMHHIYEWGQVGNSNSRLFILERSNILNGDLLISTNFLPSRLPVPTNSKLLHAGKTGKTVSKKSIFANKAKIMEEGRPVSFTAKRILAFAGTNGIAFISPGTPINILHPGGLQTKNAFAEYLLEWYTKKGHIVIDSSGLYERIANDVSVVLNSNKPNALKIKKAITKIADQIDVGDIIK